MRKALLLLFCIALSASAQRHAKNVILLLGDAGGVATLNAASIHGYDQPQALFIQQMPNIGLSDTSTAKEWVSDSAAGMTAIVTGVKTLNGVISQGPDAVRKQQDGRTLKTILEYAEENGLSTGVVTNMTVTDATPASCYAHASDRKQYSRIFQQLLDPRFGDGVDVLIGPGRSEIEKALQADGFGIDSLLAKAGRPQYSSVDAIPANVDRAIAIFESRDDFSLPKAVERAVEILSRNPKGYFLMVEGDMHTDDVTAGLNRTLELDSIARSLNDQVSRDTLLIYTADHSFDIRTHSGNRGTPLVSDEEALAPKKGPFQGKAVRRDGTHTGEEVIVAAQGPGSDRVRGYMPNTQIFHVMMDAYGWKAD
jgi:alkaline phosphatase